MILGSNWFRITKKHCQTVSVKYIYLTLWCHWHPPSLTPRCRWLCGVMTPRCLWLRGVYDTVVSMTPRCLWHCSVYDFEVSMTLWCLWLRGVYYTVVSMTPRCLWHCGALCTRKNLPKSETICKITLASEYGSEWLELWKISVHKTRSFQAFQSSIQCFRYCLAF